MRIKLLSVLAFPFIAISCINGGKSDNNGADSLAVDSAKIIKGAIPTYDKDSVHDRIAMFISGIEPYHHDSAKAVAPKTWKTYCDKINGSWKLIEEKRLNKMAEWEEEYFSNQINDTMLLFYPFSGPDFLHAYYLYPNANDYIFIANERIGHFPDFDNMTSTEMTAYLENINYFLRDIYKRSYFITGHMIKDMNKTTIKGILPIFYVFLARTGHEILDAEFCKLDSEGKVVVLTDEETEARKYNGIKFTFKKRNEHKLKTLIYYNLDLSDDGVKTKPQIGKFIKSIRKCNTYVKSASYLMHYETFSTIRNICLEKSEAIFEDDTGIPYKYFTGDTWDLVFFGVYEKPIKDFGDYLYQADLNVAYHDTSNIVLPIPFSLGYHWSTSNQNQLLAIRK
jgi:hypothetical protein